MLGLLGLRIFEACGANIQDLREEHGHRVLKVRGKGGKVVLTPLPPAVQRAIERAVDRREDGPILTHRDLVQLQMLTLDLEVRSWDLARSQGTDTPFDTELCSQLYEAFAPYTDLMAQGEAFAPCPDR